MSLDALLAPVPDRNAKHPCKVGRTIEELAEPYKSALVNLLATRYADGGLSDEALQGRLSDAGLEIGVTILNRHRRGLCTCPKATA